MSNESQSRRRFLTLIPGMAAGLVLSRRELFASTSGEAAVAHPDPRPGIDASHMLTRAQVHGSDAKEVFDMVRQIPQIADGIRCHCGCADLPGFYSLLSCYEKDGMAQHCSVCQGQGRLAFTLFKKGKALDEIRAAIDAKYD
ncbi:MAG: PCYCGC domain-containing protein [Gemmatimonadota bacterium]|nr:PCYCGC domain-containing protein [Gemmatimonadota bacterium]